KQSECPQKSLHLNFRPDFLRLAKLIPDFYKGAAVRPLLGFVTATVTQAVRDDQTAVVKKLAALLGCGMRVCPDGAEFAWRDEITTAVVRQGDERVRLMAAGELLSKKAKDGVGIVYVQSRKKTEEYSATLCSELEVDAEAFHARLPAHDKQRIIRRFRDVEEG